MTVWHADDEFWTTMAPAMFSPARWAAAPQEVDHALARLALSPPARLLDLGCGPGRHSLELARRGFQVTGVDRTTSFLAQARQAAIEAGLSVDFREGDMRTFALPETFDAVISLYTSIGYFDDPAENQAVLANVYQSLKSGGGFLVEMMGKEVLARIFQERSWREQDGILVLEERRVERSWSWMVNRWIMVHEGEARQFEISHWIYSAAEFGAMLAEAGFELIQFFGSLEGEPYDQNARRLVALGHKP